MTVVATGERLPPPSSDSPPDVTLDGDDRCHMEARAYRSQLNA